MDAYNTYIETQFSLCLAGTSGLYQRRVTGLQPVYAMWPMRRASQKLAELRFVIQYARVVLALRDFKCFRLPRVELAHRCT